MIGVIKVGMPATLLLNTWGRSVAEAFGGNLPYLVGSALAGEGRDWRDVDVRLMLPDEEWDALFGVYQTPLWTNPRWSAMCTAFSLWGAQQTGLPIDFQFQRTTEANAEFDGPRSALGLKLAARRVSPSTASESSLSA